MTDILQARFSEDYKYIIDSDNNKLSWDDPRVIHVWPISNNLNTLKLIEGIYKKRGWHFRYCTDNISKGKQYTKYLCSGRECFPCISMAEETYKDILENRNENEVSIYYNFDSPGPCQSGAWPLVWESFSRRLNLKNTIFFATPNIYNNYLGQGFSFATDMLLAVIVGDILEEAENVIKCIAKDKDEALNILHNENKFIFKSISSGILALESSLSKWADRLKKIPLKKELMQSPRILIFGGMGVMYYHQPVSDYLIEEGIIPIIEDISVGISFVNSRNIIRYGIKRGVINPADQYGIISILTSLINPMTIINNLFDFKKNLDEISMVLKARVQVEAIDFFKKRLRSIAIKSGLIIENKISFFDIINQGHKYASFSTDCDTPLIVGIYKSSVDSGLFDALVNISYFSCLPGMNAQSIIRPLASQNNIGYAAIDCEGPSISMNQLRLLETIAVQAKNSRLKKSLD